MTAPTITRFETVGALRKAINDSRGPVFADVYAGEYEITVQVVKADVLYNLDQQDPTSTDLPFYLLKNERGVFLISNS